MEQTNELCNKNRKSRVTSDKNRKKLRLISNKNRKNLWGELKYELFLKNEKKKKKKKKNKD